MDKQKLKPINGVQKGMLLDFVKNHPNLASQKFGKDFSFKKAQMLWEELATSLNSVAGGSKKTWMQWRKTWTDLKKNTKNKAANINKYQQGTGGGPPMPEDKQMTNIEKDILEIIGTVMQSGIKNVSETPLVFDFDNNNDEAEEILQINNLPETHSPNPSRIVTVVEIHDQFQQITEEVPLELSNAPPIKVRETPAGINDIEIMTPSETPSETPSQTPSTEPYTSNRNINKENDNPKKYFHMPKLHSSPEKKKPIATRRFEKSEEASGNLVKSMDQRTDMMNQYYEKKIQNLEIYRKKKLDMEGEKIKVFQEILVEVREMKAAFLEGVRDNAV
ncbi:unnamed protein product [Ceutorhynchus assimilis]|uniref:Regulatory protein zeste n=1 Tax=Ceutorhynchus assimilis TaxID=467358 RepID=A0A9N9MY24_9CUCU|nr:unnamed protein product [Ceutorhynchus assimilis]